MAYDNTNTGIMGRNDQMRPDKKDPEFKGSCDISCPHCRQTIAMWISSWVNVAGPNSKNPGRKFFKLLFKPKDAPQAQPKPAATTRPDGGINPPNDPDASDVPF